MEWAKKIKNAKIPKGVSAGYNSVNESYSDEPRIQAVTFWPVRWAKARLKVL